MSDLKNFLRDAGYFSVGAASVIIEAGGKAIKSLVRKGEETLRENQDTVDEIKRKAKEAGKKIKDAARKAAAKPESAMDASAMTPEERAELRRQLDAADEAAAQPVVPDAIYHTDEPAPAEDAPAEETAAADEDPENSANG